jgi:dTDP-4-dehydrorhamnose reductase
MKIIIIGATGMVGHVLFHELCRKNIDVIGIGRRKAEKDIINFDLYTEWDQVKCLLQNSKFDILINCSAILVNESNINKLQAIYINSFLPHLLADLFKKTETKVVHLSTGAVFSGNDEFYFEDSPLSPQTYYGITKAAGEFNNNKDLIIRSDFWGPDSKKEGTGLFNWFLNQDGTVTAYENVFFNGISNVELAGIVLDLTNNHSGIIHIGTSTRNSKSNFLEKIKKTFNLKNISLHKDNTIKKSVYLRSKKIIPHINDFDTMIKDVYQYLMNNKESYLANYPQIYEK